MKKQSRLKQPEDEGKIRLENLPAFWHGTKPVTEKKLRELSDLIDKQKSKVTGLFTYAQVQSLLLAQEEKMKKNMRIDLREAQDAGFHEACEKIKGNLGEKEVYKFSRILDKYK